MRRIILLAVTAAVLAATIMVSSLSAAWNTFYSAALIQLFPAHSVLGSYLNLTIAAGALALVIVALTGGRLGYQQEEEPGTATAPT